MPSVPRLFRSMGNAQSRNPALPGMPAYGNTTNPNGAQTASQQTMFGKRPVQNTLHPTQDQFSNQFTFKPQHAGFHGPQLPASQQELPHAGGNVAGIADKPQHAGFNGPQLVPSVSPPYAGGDVAGIAAYYRNSGMQRYTNPVPPMFPMSGFPINRDTIGSASGVMNNILRQGLVRQFGPSFENMAPQSSQVSEARGIVDHLKGLVPGKQPQPVDALSGMRDRTDAAIGFLRANPSVPLTSQIARLTAGSMPAAAMNAATASAVNQYANPVMGLSPDQKLQIAQQSAARTMGGGPVADPTGLGLRMAGISANPIPWYDRVKQGQQAQAQEASRANQLSQEYLAGIPANAAMNQTYTGPFSKQTPSGLAYTNRTGALEQMAAANPNSRNIQDALDTENLAGQMRASLTADRLQKYKDSHEGLSARQFRRKKETELRIERQLKTGKINKEEAAIQKQMAGISPKSPAQSGNVDRVRLPNGQLPDATREKAATTAKNLTDPNYTGPSPEFQKQSEIVRSIGLTTDMNANSAANAIRNTPIPDDPRAQKEFVAALRKYWGSMKDSDAEWASAGDSEEAAALNQLSELPDSKVDEWMKTWSGIINRRQTQQNEQDKIRNSPSPYGGDFYQF